MRYPTLKNEARSCGFTLVEMLAVVSIIAVLIALAYPAVVSMRAKSDSVKTISQLRHIGNLFSLYVNENNGYAPPTLTILDTGARRTWRYHLMKMYTGEFSHTPAHLQATAASDYPFWSPTYVRQYGRTDHIQGYGSFSMNAYFRDPRRIHGYRSNVTGSSEPLVVDGTPANLANTPVGASVNLFSMTPSIHGGVADYYPDGRVHALFLDGHVRILDKEEQAALDPAVRDINSFQ